jgi:hypothetical protein
VQRNRGENAVTVHICGRNFAAAVASAVLALRRPANTPTDATEIGIDSFGTTAGRSTRTVGKEDHPVTDRECGGVLLLFCTVILEVLRAAVGFTC